MSIERSEVADALQAPDGRTRDNAGNGDLRATGGDGGAGRDAASAVSAEEVLTAELTRLRVRLAMREGELEGLREALRVAEAGVRAAAQRADMAEQAALDAWWTTADLARLLARAEPTATPARLSPRRRGRLARVSG